SASRCPKFSESARPAQSNTTSARSRETIFPGNFSSAARRTPQLPRTLRLPFHRISAAAQDRRIFCLELLNGVAKLGRFVDSTGSIRFGIEKQNHVLSTILRERHFFTVVGRYLEGRRLVAFFQHLRCFRFRCHQDPTLPRALA